VTLCGPFFHHHRWIRGAFLDHESEGRLNLEPYTHCSLVVKRRIGLSVFSAVVYFMAGHKDTPFKHYPAALGWVGAPPKTVRAAPAPVTLPVRTFPMANLTEQALETAALPGAPGRLTEVLVDAHGSIGSPSERHGLLCRTLAALARGEATGPGEDGRR
jgi:hypothetical protein